MGDKKARLPFKIMDNAISGQMKQKGSALYDPMSNNSICINGQLLLLDLIEHIEPYCELIQNNTDGIVIKLNDYENDFDVIDKIVAEWESRTGMSLGFDVITEIWQKDVNNYIFKFEDGKIERKGAYVKPLNDLDNDLPIVNAAMVAFMVDGVKPERTIGACEDLKDFQKIVKLSSKYKCAWHNGCKLGEKTFRVFASLNPSDGYIGKQKDDGYTIEKFANTPDHCFIVNGDVNDTPAPDGLDKDYCILAIKEIINRG